MSGRNAASFLGLSPTTPAAILLTCPVPTAVDDGAEAVDAGFDVVALPM